MSSPKAPTPLLPLNTRFGPYQLEKLVAVGGMAEIYLARAKGLAGFEKQLALKVINAELASDEQFIRMLVQEAKVAVTLNHSNIVNTFDLGKIGNVYYISMEYVDGLDLFQLLRFQYNKHRKLPVSAAIFVARAVAAGLAHAHSRTDDEGRPLNLIHRDISPQNVLLSRDGGVKIADFGVAKVANASGGTRAGVIKGKLVYMSPEQSWGEQIDQRSDIFSAGIVLYESIIGGALYSEQSPVKLLHQVRKADIPPPSTQRPELDQEVDELVMKAVARDPDDRYATAHEFETALASYLVEFAPEFKSRDLGLFVREAASDDLAARPMPAPRRSSGRPVDVMTRDDFAVPNHSMVQPPPGTEQDADDERANNERANDVVRHDQGRVARVTLLDGRDEKRFAVGERFTIGRGGELRLTDGRVSRRHARILAQGDQYTIEDLDSSNGTFVNRVRVDRPTSLKSGDLIQIGPYEMRFDLENLFLESAPDHGAKAADSESGSAEEAMTPVAIARRDSEAPREAGVPEVAHACLVLQAGQETVRLPVYERFPLEHTIVIGGVGMGGATSAIVRRGAHYWIEPADGRNAVMLNGDVVGEPQQLDSGDELQVGPVLVKFELDDPESRQGESV